MKVNNNYNLVTEDPLVARDWNYEKNGTLSPFEVAPKSNRKVWWKCSFNSQHEWQARISNRTIKHDGCPKCYHELKVSFPAKIIYFYLKKLFEKADCEYKIGPYRVDIYIPELNLVIEHDGHYYHNRKDAHQRENRKDDYLQSHGYQILRIKEINTIPPKIVKSEDIIYYKHTYQYKDSLNHLIQEILRYISRLTNYYYELDIDLERDYFLIDQFFFHEKKKKTLAYIDPELAKEWSPNNPISPDLVCGKSNQNYLWICPNCHYEYSATLSNRLNAKSACPYCSNRKVNKDNCFATKCPQLLKEWDYEKNIGISPYEVVPGAEKMIWWKCSKGHSWQTYLFQRTGKKKSGCPFCAHLQVYEEISLAHCYPDTLIWWDQKANAPITPHDITAYSNKKFYFQCPVCNHSFKRSPNEFVQLMKENRCPKCRQRKIQNRQLNNIRKYWSSENHIPLDHHILASQEEYLWECEKHHKWSATVTEMKERNRKCPYCVPNTTKDILPEYLLKEWDYERNHSLDPKLLTIGSGRKVWWKCSKGHSWPETITKRAIRHYGCPYCSGRRASKEYSFPALFPKLLEYWDYSKNKIDPYTLTPGSTKKFHWKCPKCGYEFERSIIQMTKTSRCKNCEKPKRYESLDKTSPELIKEWNTQKNPLPPSSYSGHSNQQVWWKCSTCHHEWTATIYNRTARKSGCPNCHKKRKLSLDNFTIK